MTTFQGAYFTKDAANKQKSLLIEAGYRGVKVFYKPGQSAFGNNYFVYYESKPVFGPHKAKGGARKLREYKPKSNVVVAPAKPREVFKGMFQDKR